MSKDRATACVAACSSIPTYQLTAEDGMPTDLWLTIESLRRQLTDSQKREVMLREFVQKIKEQTPEKPDYWSSCSQCEHNSNEAEDILEALAATEPKE